MPDFHLSTLSLRSISQRTPNCSPLDDMRKKESALLRYESFIIWMSRTSHKLSSSSSESHSSHVIKTEITYITIKLFYQIHTFYSFLRLEFPFPDVRALRKRVEIESAFEGCLIHRLRLRKNLYNRYKLHT
ncbi:hypothetical protein Zmor_021137 [Zophobas morio]|uniref:Uncharacterized protein n=1 Tax=Zophobas morio TaxID=2755281 RepID=A0AA38I588_9CUCU|nr:hypothetical protein Zmor_021137 [Zophobas morio]